MPYEVEAFGSIIEVPDDVSHEDAYKQIMANEHKINPNYKKPLSARINDFYKENLGNVFGQKKSIADQAEESATEGENTAAQKVPGAPVRQSTYNQALLNVTDDTNGVLANIGNKPPVDEGGIDPELRRIRQAEGSAGPIPIPRSKPEQLVANNTGIKSRIANAANEDIKGQVNQRELEGLRTDENIPEGGFIASAKSMAGQTIKGAGQIGSDYFDSGKNNALIEYGNEILRNNPLAVKSLEDIKDQPFMAFKEASGNMVPSFGAMLGTAAVGQGIMSVAPLTGPAAPIVAAVGVAVKWLGPAAIAALPSYSGIRDKQIFNNKSNEDSSKAKAIALLGASAVGAIEVAFGPQNWAITMLTKEGRVALARKFAATTPLQAFAKGAVIGGLSEKSEELAQNPIEQLASFEDPTTKENLKETAFGGAMGLIGGIVPGGVTNTAGFISQNAQSRADRINAERRKLGLDKIQSAETVDEAIKAANETVSAKPVDKEDVLKSADPTLADIERLTGLKPSEAIQAREDILKGETNNEDQTTSKTDGTILQSPKETEIVLPDNTTVKAQWDIVDADSVKASLKSGESQPRDRTRATSDLQIQSISKNPDYRRLSNSPVMDIGAPVLSNDGQIVGGNGRFEALSRAYEQGTSQEYLDKLRQDAINKGIDPAVLDSMSKPVLVRRISQPFDTKTLAISSNSGTSLQYSALEQANIDSDRMKGIENLDVTDSGDIALTPKNITQLKDSLGSFTAAELGSLVDKGGQLSQEGVRRVRNAMLAKAYRNTLALEKIVESTDTDMRNVLGALTRSSGIVAQVRSSAPQELDITENLLNAVDTLSQIKSKGQTLDSYLAQDNIFGDNIDPDSKEILQFLNDNIRSQKKLTEFIKEVYSRIGNIDQSTDDIFGDNTLPTKSELIQNAKQATGKQAAEQSDIFNSSNKQKSKTEASDAGIGAESKPTQGLKDARISKLEKYLKDSGYDFTIESASVRDIDAMDSAKKARKELAEKQAKLFKKKVIFIKSYGPFRINGVMVPSIADTIFVDIRTDKAFDAIMAHELSHWMEQEKPAVYKELVKSLKTVIINEAEYAKKYGIEGATKAEITKEIVGDLMGDNFVEQSFWQKVAEANPKAFKDIAAAIIKWLKGVIVKAKANSMGSEQWVKDATKAQDIIAKAVAQYIESDAAPVSTESKPKFHKAFHGSPHDHNKFESSKIGTGEGAQAYGYGHYFAESKDVAEFYKKTLSNDDNYATSDGTVWSPNTLKNLNARVKVRDALRKDTDLGKPIVQVQDMLDRNESEKMREMLRIDLSNLQDIQARGGLKNTLGKLYEVELAPEQDEYLLWDKPLSEQSDKVKSALGEGGIKSDEVEAGKLNTRLRTLNRLIDSGGAAAQDAIKDKQSLLDKLDEYDPDAEGSDIYKKLSSSNGSDKKASEYLHSLGIRGIKYLDGSSRAKGEGAYNYVIFDDKDVSITAKFSKAAVENTLIAQHNLTAKNLIHVDRMGGLAAPSIAITDKKHPLHGFGEITLLADEDFVNNARTFGADIYSTRYPEVSYDFSNKDIQKLNDQFKTEKSRLGESDFYSSNMDDPQRIMKESPAVAMKFLEAEGIKPKIKYVTPDEKPSANVLKWAKTTLDRQELTREPKFIEDVKKDYIAKFKDVPAEEMDGILPENDDQWRNLAVRQAFKVTNYRESLNNKGKVDIDDTRRSLIEQIRLNKRSDKFSAYIDNIITEINPKQEIFDKLTNTGTGRKYIEHNLDNVIRKMRSSFVGGESFGFGLGRIRGVHAPEFKSIEQIRKNKSRLMNSKDFDAIKDDVSKELTQLVEKVDKYGTYSGYDNVEQAIFDSAKMGIPKALTYNGFKNVPSDIKSEIEEFIEKLRNMPTEYFEAKVLRGVKLGEFKAAIVPRDIPQEALDILKKNGIEDIRKYKSGDNEDRVKQINKVTHVMFSREAKTITVDGVERPTENSEGKLINNPVNFWKWFGDSKVVDDQGRPLVVYHRTDADISTFDKNKLGENTLGNASNDAYAATSLLGFWFNSNPYKGKSAGGGSVNMPVYIKVWSVRDEGSLAGLAESVGEYLTGDLIEDYDNDIFYYANNAATGYVDSLERNGYDGIIIDDEEFGGLSYVVFDPNQIKSAIGNNGDYSSTNNDIRFSREEPQQPKKFSPNEDIPETNFRKAQRVIQDKFNRFTVVNEFLQKQGITLSENANVYKAEERYHAKVANQLEDFREGTRNPLVEKIAKAGFKLDQVEEYLLHNHAQEANAQNRKLTGEEDSTAYGITDQEAKDYLDKAPKELAKLADEVQAITQATQQLRLDNGIESQERVDAMNGAYKYYVPVRGDAESQEKQSKGQGTGQGYGIKYKGKRRLGHGKRNEAVMDNIFQDYERAVIQVEKNRVAKSLALMAAEVQMPELISIDQPVKRKVLQNQKAYGVMVKGDLVDVFQTQEAANQNRQLLVSTDKKLTLSDITIAPITDQRLIYSASPMLADNEVLVYMDGHELRLQINDDLAARAYKNMGIEALGSILSIGRAMNGWMSKVYTGYAPEFLLVNLQRDFQSGIINLTGEQGALIATKAVANYPKSFSALLKYAATGKSTEWIDAYRDNGGNTGAAYLPDLERLGTEVKREYAAYQGVIANLKEKDAANALRAAGRKTFNATLKYIEYMNQAGENAFRLATFKAMIDSGKSVKEAASMAKNVTVNFNRKGEIGAEMNALYLFFNASVQGTAAVSHALFKGRHKYQAWGMAGGMMTLGYLMASALGGFDDEDKYDEISDQTKSRNMIMSYGDGYVKIPVPYGHGFFYNSGRMYAEAQRKGELGKLPYQLAALATEEFSPFNVASTEDGEFNSKKVMYGLLPTALRIPMELSNNFSSFTGRELYPEKSWYRSEPDNEKMWRGTKGTAYDVSAQYLASIGIEISPEVLKSLTRTVTGGSGAFVDSSISAAMLKKEGAELDTREIPFVRKMYGEATIQDKRARFGKMADEARIAKEKFNAAKRDNDLSTLEKVMKDKGELLYLNEYANKTSEVIKLFRDQQDSIKLSDEYTTAEKRLKIKELEREEEGFYKMFFDEFKKIDRSKLN